MDNNTLIEYLRTTLLWENVCGYIERREEADVLLHRAGGNDTVTAHSAFIQDSGAFNITDVSENGGRIAMNFEMPFILCVNEKYSVEAVAAGRLDIPSTENYPYKAYRFQTMVKTELLSFRSIVCISHVSYRDVEMISVFCEKQSSFLKEIRSIHWFENSGSPNGKYDMCFSLYEACDGWEKQYVAVWEPLICALEDIAVEKIGDDAINKIFAVVSAAIRDTCWEKFVAFIEKQHSDEGFAVSFDLFDRIKRDMAWAGVEKVLDMCGFFTMLTGIYKEGYFPCSWNGAYPFGKAVVL